MPPKRQPGPKRVVTPVQLDDRKRKEGKRLPFLDEWAADNIEKSKVGGHLTSAELWDSYLGFVLALDHLVLSPEDRNYILKRSKASIVRQLGSWLRHRGWDWHNGVGELSFKVTTQEPKDDWKFDPQSFINRQPLLGSLPIVRRASLIPGAGSGMFSTAPISKNECIVEYKGTVVLVTEDELDTLSQLHEDDGNGLVDLCSPSGAPCRNKSRDRQYVLNPYIVSGRPVELASRNGAGRNNAC